MIIRTRIREMREDGDLSQKTVADFLRCDQSLYAKYELNKRDIPLHIIGNLSAFYETSTDYHLYLTDDPSLYRKSVNA